MCVHYVCLFVTCQTTLLSHSLSFLLPTSTPSCYFFPLSPQSTGRVGNHSYLSTFSSKSLPVDHWPALPSPAPPSSSSVVTPTVQLTPGKTSKGVDWSVGSGGGKDNGEGLKGEEGGKGEGELQHLMKSLDIVEHLHVLQVRFLVFARVVSGHTSILLMHRVCAWACAL